MNQVSIVVQSKEDLKNLLDSQEKVDKLPQGLTVVFMEGATKGGQLGIEFIIKGKDIYGNDTVNGFAVTENNMESIIGGFIGVRMRFGRMPEDQWEMVRHYLKDQIKTFIDKSKFVDDGKELIRTSDLRKYFRI